MRTRICFLLVLVVLGLVRLRLLAQEMPTLRSGTTVVLVPTLVTDVKGATVFGLSEKDFAVLDNGVEQKVQLDEVIRSGNTSLVVAIEKGRHPDDTLDKVHRLSSMLYPIIGEGKGEAAVVAFDSSPVLIQDFTGDLDRVAQALNRIQPGDYNAALLDAISFSAGLLEKRPKTDRKVLLLVSEPSDRGSANKIPTILRQIERSNVLVYSAGYSPSTVSSLFGKSQAEKASSSGNLLALFSALSRSAKENTAKTVAELSGGEYFPFADARKLEDGLADISNHYFNQYLLSFTPKALSLGQHTLRVYVRGRSDVQTFSRSGYWVGPDPNDEQVGEAKQP